MWNLFWKFPSYEMHQSKILLANKDILYNIFAAKHFLRSNCNISNGKSLFAESVYCKSIFLSRFLLHLLHISILNISFFNVSSDRQNDLEILFPRKRKWFTLKFGEILDSKIFGFQNGCRIYHLCVILNIFTSS